MRGGGKSPERGAGVCVCSVPAWRHDILVGGKGTLTFWERALAPACPVGAGWLGGLVRSGVWGGASPERLAKALAYAGETSRPRARGTEIAVLSQRVRVCLRDLLRPPLPQAESLLPSLAGCSAEDLFYRFRRKQAMRSQIRNEPPLGKVVTEKGKTSIFAFTWPPLPSPV